MLIPVSVRATLTFRAFQSLCGVLEFSPKDIY